MRVPVVPGFNDTPEEIAAIARYAQELGAHRLHLLPYHRLGADKYTSLGRTYELAHLVPPDDAKMASLLRVAQEFTTPCQIGG